MAGAVADWTTGLIASHRVWMIEVSTGSYIDPADVLTEVDARRRSIRRAYDHQQRQDDRWGDVQQYAAWMPRFDGVSWSASMQGIVYTGRIAEVRYLDDLGDRHEVKLRSFDRCLTHGDVREHMTRALTCAHGMARADDLGLAAMAAEIDRRGGYKALLARRGLQRGQA